MVLLLHYTFPLQLNARTQQISTKSTSTLHLPSIRPDNTLNWGPYTPICGYLEGPGSEGFWSLTGLSLQQTQAAKVFVFEPFDHSCHLWLLVGRRENLEAS